MAHAMTTDEIRRASAAFLSALRDGCPKFEDVR